MQNLISEKEKHRCAVRQICAWRVIWGQKKMAEYLAKHGFSYQFLSDVKEQWAKGNRGQYGEWK
jgi:hypothetical protein